MTSMLATLGICFGVMTLIVVMSVMNGFQMKFIDSIMEVSSYHIRVTGFDELTENRIREYISSNKRIKSVTCLPDDPGGREISNACRKI